MRKATRFFVVLLLLSVVIAAGVWWFAEDHSPGEEPRPAAVTEDTASSPPADASPSTPLPAHVALGQPGTISGTARFADTNAPAPGVEVRVINPSDDSEVTAETDDSGRYVVSGIHAPQNGVDLMVVVRASRPGYRARLDVKLPRFFANQSYEGIDISVVRNTASISGTVYATETEWHTERIRSVMPDLIGRSGPESFQTFEERLISEMKRPLPGVTLTLGPAPAGGSATALQTVSDANGRYTFTDLSPGSYQVSAVLPEDAVQLQQATSQMLELEDGETRDEVDLVIDFDAVSVSGRVLDDTGVGIPHARVTAVRVQYNADGSGTDTTVPEMVHSAIADDKGQYRIAGLLPFDYFGTAGFLSSGATRADAGYYTVCAEADGYTPAQIAVPPVREELATFVKTFIQVLKEWEDEASLMDLDLPLASGGRIQGIDIVLEPAARISGTLVDTTDVALPDTKLRLVFAAPPAEQDVAFQREVRAPDWVTTNASGAFLFDAVPAGQYVFEIDAASGPQRARNAPITITKGRVLEGITVVVESASQRGSLAGTVVSAATGAPVEDFDVRMLEVDAPGENFPRLGNLAATDERGAFRIEDISAGLATVEVKAEGYGPQVFQADIRPGQTAEVSVKLEAEGILRGRVRRNGQPSGYGYIFFPELEGYFHDGTDDNGRFEVKGLPAGTHLVRFTMWLYEDQRGGAQANYFERVAIAAGEVTTIEVDYDGAGVVQGAFVGPPGSTEWRVTLTDPSAPPGEDQRATTWKFQENGRYEIVDMPPGAYNVIATCDTADGTSIELSDRVTVQDGEPVTLDFRFP
jgi:hypothetical protein